MRAVAGQGGGGRSRVRAMAGRGGGGRGGRDGSGQGWTFAASVIG